MREPLNIEDLKYPIKYALLKVTGSGGYIYGNPNFLKDIDVCKASFDEKKGLCKCFEEAIEANFGYKMQGSFSGLSFIRARKIN